MNKLIFIALMFFITGSIYSQKFLLVENVNSLKNFKYFQGDAILIKLEGQDKKMTDVISDLTDSTVVFEMWGEVKMTDISCIYRENWLIKILSGFSLLAGTLYFGIDTFNRTINHQYPVIDTEVLMISGGIVAFSLALLPFKYKKIHPGGKWQLRAIDMEAF